MGKITFLSQNKSLPVLRKPPCPPKEVSWRIMGERFFVIRKFINIYKSPIAKSAAIYWGSGTLLWRAGRPKAYCKKR
jgi:hypothetical protein